ncbi:hypothetical protein ACIP46_07190 [Streptomyces lavendulae]|uniref:hypothetical protein n=1 Tax=Streptomyces lavendulae TaxID=1914 RepID=UPI0024A51427|nr:hypothetical protein [Streptomyces lavendulae]GLV99063.1 hypothetical protein Slala05_26950 [Streptomyces lavendulae subsp. lavendulae]
MDPRPPTPDQRLGPHPLTEEGIAALLARYAFGDSCLRRVVLDQEYGPRAAGGRLARLVIDARVVSEDLRWEPVCLELHHVRRFRIDESAAFSWVLYDPPRFTRFDGLLQVDLCAERFGSLRPETASEVFEGSELVFESAGGTWSALRPWER